MTVDAGDEHDKLVAVCGGLASEPAAVPILIGLGVRELSVVPTLVPQLKSLIRTLTIEACRALAQRALAMDTAEAVRALANEFCVSETRAISSAGGRHEKLFTGLQPIGRALMLPIAVLPVAALLLRLGQPDLLDMPAIAAAGDAIFSNLGLLFAIGVAVGLARENHGAAGLASVVGYLVTTKGAEVLIAVPPEVTAELTGRARDLAIAAFRARELAKLSVPAGLLSGLIAGWLYNRYSDIRLPSYLAFFGGRRFVPIASGMRRHRARAGVRFRLAGARARHGCDEPGGARRRSRSACSLMAC